MIKKLAVGSTITFVIAGGTACGSADPLPLEQDNTNWSPVVAADSFHNDGTDKEVALRLSEGGGCWKLTETVPAGQSSSVSACHGGGVTAASHVLGVVVGISQCTGRVVVVAPKSGEELTVDSSQGTFLVPRSFAVLLTDELTIRCRLEDGGEGFQVSVAIAG